jgi:hypothetical protein
VASSDACRSENIEETDNTIKSYTYKNCDLEYGEMSAVRRYFNIITDV